MRIFKDRYIAGAGAVSVAAYVATYPIPSPLDWATFLIGVTGSGLTWYGVIGRWRYVRLLKRNRQKEREAPGGYLVPPPTAAELRAIATSSGFPKPGKAMILGEPMRVSPMHGGTPGEPDEEY